MTYLRLDHEIWSSGVCCVVLVIILASSSLDLPYPCSAGGLIATPNCSGNDSNKANVYNLLVNMRIVKTSFFAGNFGTGADQVYGSYLCQAHLTSKDCSDCVEKACTDIFNSCPNQVNAKVRYDKCILQYSGEPFFGKLANDYMSWSAGIEFEDAQVAEFDMVLNDTLTKVAQKAVADQTTNRKYATREVNLTFNGSSTMYMLAQCMPDLSSDLCLQCLNHSITNELPTWCNKKRGGRTISSSCIIRYEMSRFYSEVQAPAPAPPLAPPALFPPPPRGSSWIDQILHIYHRRYKMVSYI